MAQISSEPRIRNRNKAYLRATQVRDALVQLAKGATAADVRSAVMDTTKERVGLDAIKTSLWHLHSLGIVDFTVDRGSRVWSIVGKKPKKGKA